MRGARADSGEKVKDDLLVDARVSPEDDSARQRAGDERAPRRPLLPSPAEPDRRIRRRGC